MAPLRSFLALCAAALAPSVYGAFVSFKLDLTWEVGAPNGEPREMVFMNGQFPGPELRIDQGDDVEVCFHS